MVSTPSRRGVLSAIVALPVIASAPVMAAITSPYDPDSAFARWKAVHTDIEAWPEEDGDEHLWDRLKALEDDILRNAPASMRALEVSLWVGLGHLLTYNWEHRAIMSEDIDTLVRRNENHDMADRLVIDSIVAVRRLAERGA
jgi:hypothetical protein